MLHEHMLPEQLVLEQLLQEHNFGQKSHISGLLGMNRLLVFGVAIKQYVLPSMNRISSIWLFFYTKEKSRSRIKVTVTMLKNRADIVTGTTHQFLP